MTIRLPFMALSFGLIASTALAQLSETEARWNERVEPFRIAGNLHYVGTRELGSYLVTTDEGHILIDSGFEESVPLILQNIGRLGYRAEDVRILLTTQAHKDHIGGLATIKRLTGARLLMSRADAAIAASGGRSDHAFPEYTYPAVIADGYVEDGTPVSLGGSTVRAMLTPGHTRGCTTWRITVEEESRSLEAAVLCSVSAPGYRLRDNPLYPSIAADFSRTFARLRSIQPDIFLASHGSFFNLDAKRDALKNSSANPFINTGEWIPHIERMQRTFEEELERQTTP